MINFAKDIGIEPNTLEGAWQTNLIVRPEKDWSFKTEYLEFYQGWMAEGYAAARKAVYAGSIPASALHRQLKIMRNILIVGSGSIALQHKKNLSKVENKIYTIKSSSHCNK